MKIWHCRLSVVLQLGSPIRNIGSTKNKALTMKSETVPAKKELCGLSSETEDKYIKRYLIRTCVS